MFIYAYCLHCDKLIDNNDIYNGLCEDCNIIDVIRREKGLKPKARICRICKKSLKTIVNDKEKRNYHKKCLIQMSLNIPQLFI
jgi:hypothetical protein